MLKRATACAVLWVCENLALRHSAQVQIMEIAYFAPCVRIFRMQAFVCVCTSETNIFFCSQHKET